MKSIAAAATLALCLVGCGGGDRTADATASGSATLMPTVYLPDGTVTTACALEPLCSGTLTVPGSYRDYRITRNLDTYILTSNSGTSQVLAVQIHRLRFADAEVDLQTDGVAGQAYRLYQAAFNRQPDLAGLGLWISAMRNGMSLLDVANAFYQSAEFKSIYGSNPSNTELITRYYRNALQREPEPAGLNYWVGLLDAGALTPAQVLVQFSESPENKARVLAAIQFGVTFIPPDLQPPVPGSFQAKVSLAPPNTWYVSGIVHLEVRGSGMRNVELLPASGYLPRYGVFNVSADGTVATLDFDTRTLPNGARDFRISAFSAPSGDPSAAEIVAMPVRQWVINNNAPPPVPVFTAAVTNAPNAGAVLTGVVRFEVRGSGIENAELLPADGYQPIYGRFNLSPDRTFAWLDFNTNQLPSGPYAMRISAYNVPPGQPGASEIVAMPARQWLLVH
ncbi:DUF4214 domain-containing protein [Oxalobacteraceae bacterium OM1]|nr:DUF4214 domain-containing protein [Oxalobacteraceae bacterium OM1]